MTQAPAVNVELPAALRCPIEGCTRTLVQREGKWFCGKHDAYFSVEEFTPSRLTVDRIEGASEQHAICAHHPEHRAVAVCAGTGNYICALCAVDIDGTPYSVQFLDSAAGKTVLDQRFASSLSRPDRVVWQLLACVLVLPISAFMIFPAFIWVPVGFIYWVKALRLRRQNALYGQLVRRWHVGFMLSALLLWAAAGVLIWCALLLGLFAKAHPHQRF